MDTCISVWGIFNDERKNERVKRKTDIIEL